MAPFRINPEDLQDYKNNEVSESTDSTEQENNDHVQEDVGTYDVGNTVEDDDIGEMDIDEDELEELIHEDFQLSYNEVQYKHHTKGVLSITLNPVNSSEFVTGGMDDQLAFWDINQETPKCSFKLSESGNNVAVSFDGNLVGCSVMNNQIKVYSKQDNTFTEKYSFTGFDDELSVSLKVAYFPP